MKSTCLCAVILSVLTCCSLAQDRVPVETRQALIDQAVAQFNLVNGTLLDGVEKLSHEQTGHFGIEEILRGTFTDQPVVSPRFSIHLTNTSVKNVLDGLCQHDPRYVWSSDGTSLNVYPSSTVKDPSYLLNRTAPHITLRSVPNPDQGLFVLGQELPPPKEQLGYIETGGDNSYSSPWTTSFNHITVRQFVNKLAEHLGPSTIWSLHGSQQERLFSFSRR